MEWIFQKTLYYFLFLHFVFLHFLTLQTMSIFLDLTLFLFSLSQQDHPSPVKIFVAGHRGLVGLAIVWKLYHLGFVNLVLHTHAELDLKHQSDVGAFFATKKPRFMILAIAMVGDIHANNTYLADFIVVKPRPPPNPPGVVAPPPCHAGGGRPANGVAGHPYNFSFFFFLIEFFFFLKKKKLMVGFLVIFV
jgi:hypothetical protein